MTGEFAHLVRCLDVREKDVADAVASRDRTKALLLHLADCSAPNTGVAKVLLVFARMATTACDWIDGDLVVELVGDEEVTVVEVHTELGGGLRERLFAPASFRAPLVEFSRAIERVPHLVAPLTIRSASARRISLSASALVRRTTVPPPPVEIAEDSLFVRAPAPALPVFQPVQASMAPAEDPLIPDVDGGWDD
jgi:hypothetical protein